ncbi:synaptic vesicle glycoprotein 2C isoform X1 [Neodiprion lecontei]|uniref:Synaptic vesicle glycoprotein 2C isoform X1 n=1 Tax=Neodiprion lecontei TaxID=441921 RepID=A0ABM3FVG7_NEOLC|nr:synaptic vesicle glycoprotein 2C isoform X1 [Neodiprion lecontei]
MKKLQEEEQQLLFDYDGPSDSSSIAAVDFSGTIEKSGDESASFERAMHLAGHGRYHVSLMLVCGLISIATGFQNSLSAYILPAAQCDLDLTSTEMGLLNAAIPLGGTLSAMLWGVVADATGRRHIMIWCLLIDGIVTLLSSLSQNFPILFILRFINGFVIGGPSTVIVSFLGEFHPEKTRATAICYLGMFWTISGIVLPGFAWIIIPLEFNVVVCGLVFNSWRLFVGILAIPSLVSAFLISKYPESPKFLISQGKHKKALQILREVFASNTGMQAHQYPVAVLTYDHHKSNDECNSIKATVSKMSEQLHQVFAPPLLKYTALISFIMFTNMFGGLGLGLWFPELFNRFEAYYKSHPNQTITVCELAHLREENLGLTNLQSVGHVHISSNFTSQIISIASNLTSISVDDTFEKCDSFVDDKVFINTIIMGLSCLLGNFASILLAGRLDRRIMPIATGVISGIAGVLIYFLRSSTQNLIVACLFSSLSSTANVVICSVIVDVFPTNVNSMAMCAATLAGRFGAIISNLLFGLLFKTSCEIPIFLIGGLVTCGGILGIYLPKNLVDVPEKNRRSFPIPQKNLPEDMEKQMFNPAG